MHKSFFLIIIFAVVFGHSLSALSQPSAILQFYGGYSLPTGDFKGTFGSTLATFTSNPDSNTYFMKTGYCYGISLKKLFGKKKNLYLSGELSFNLFHQNVDFNLNTSNPENMKLRINVTSVNLGAGWFFNPKKGLNPFVELGLIASYFSGTLDDILATIDTQHLLRGTFRLGFQAGAGVDVPIQYNVGLAFGTKFSFANIIGKSYEIDDAQNYGLNDKEHTINNSIYPARNITFLQFYGGVSFYFGR